MSTIVQQPDSLSFAGNLKKLIITSAVAVSIQLACGEEQILNETYQPGADNLVEVDLGAIIDKVLSVSLPGTALVTEQPSGVANFVATIDDVAVAFRVVKGGVAELQEPAVSFTNNHFLSWQVQDKKVLQHQPEWLTVYANDIRKLWVKAYYRDTTEDLILLASLLAGKLQTVNVSWASINSIFEKKNPIAWEVWFEDVTGTRLSYIQRYCLRNPEEEEKIFIWHNTLGGIDSISLTGSAEDDKKLEHLVAEMGDESLLEYQTNKNWEIKQSTGYLTRDESRWIEDFFYSGHRYLVDADGVIRPIVLSGSKVVSSSADDLFDYEFTYRLASESQLLNLDRSFEPLPILEVPADFFLTELLSGLPVAHYANSLILAVQSPFATLWQQLSMAQLWGGALPSLVDNSTITVANGKLNVIAGTPGSLNWEEIKNYIDGLQTGNDINDISDTRTEIISGAILWKQGLTYTATDICYKILGVAYTSRAKEIMLESADPSLSRIDLLYVDSFGNLQVAKGIPSINPASPVLDSTQLEVMSVLILPGAVSPQGLEVENIYNENAEWATTQSHDEYVSVDFESSSEPLNGSKRIKIVIDCPETGVGSPLHYIGEKYQGGVIFWLDATGKKGLIAAENDAATGVFWSALSGFSTYTTGASGNEIGTGQVNTSLMLAGAAAKDHAIKYCNELIVETFDDWFLPSEKELDAMYFRRFAIGNFGNKTYWSSTEVTGSNNWKKARCISFGNGVAYTRDKNNSYCVRAVRAFDDTAPGPGQPVAYFTPLATKMIFSAPYPVKVTDSILSLNIKSSIPWRFNSALVIESYLEGRKTGSVAMSPSTSTWGYQSDNDQWQVVAIPMSKFIANCDTLDSFRISLAGSWPNKIDLGIDDIRYQHCEVKTTGTGQGNTLKIDYHLAEMPDGIRTEFTTAQPYKPGTTQLFINGIRQFQGENDDYTEANGKIVLAVAPEEDDDLICDYISL